MTDSESDIDDMLPNNIYSYQSGSTMISAKGPALNRPRYAQSTCDNYRGTFNERAGSQSTCDNYKETFNGRAGSPTMSIQTMYSNVSAMDIAAALKSDKFNKNELRMMEYACSKFLKHRHRQRVEKRKRQFKKRMRRKSRDDSGELGSDSSISSDDRRSTKTSRTAYRGNTSSCRSTRTVLADFRRTMMEFNMYRDRTDDLRQNSLRNMISVQPRSLNENTLKPQMLSQSNTCAISQKNIFQNDYLLPSQRTLLPISEKENRNTSVISLKDRFKNGFLLPSKRFNQSTASLPIPEKENRWQKPNMRNIENPNKGQVNHEIESEQEEIFSETTLEKTTFNGKKSQGKRSLDPDEDICIPNNKRNKLSSPLSKNAASKLSVSKQTGSANDRKNSNDFEFVKPQFPIKKLGKVVVTKSQLTKKLSPKLAQQPSEKIISSSNHQLAKSDQKFTEKVSSKSSQKSTEKVTSQTSQKSTSKSTQKSTEKVTSKASLKPVEKLITKPAQHPTEALIYKHAQQPTEVIISKSSQPIEALDQPAVQNIPQTIAHHAKEQTEEISPFSTTDMSMRPSFIKRKLFTQKVDAESKNSSSDNLTDSSQSNIYSAIQKEKNKTRKLTTQSCLSRDVLGDDSNLLDLIHKIVPKDRMSTTAAVNKTAVTNKSKAAHTESKWDVIAEISMCNNDNDVSDTYTDEEIFKANEESQITNEKASEKVKTPKQSINVKKCSVVVPKMPSNNKILTEVARKSNSPEVVNKIIGDNGLEECNLYKKSFWDTDSGSDIDFDGTSRRKSILKDNFSKGTSIYNNVTKNSQHSKRNNVPINRPLPEIAVLPNPKTKPIKTVEKDSGNNKRNPTTTEAPNVSPQEPKITPNPKIKPIKTVEKDSGNNKRNPTTTEAPNVSPKEPKIAPNPKTKPIKTVKKDSGNNKRNPTTTEAPNVSPQEPKITLNPKTKPIKTVEKDSGNNKRNPTTTEAPNVSPQEPKITLNPKTKPIKTVEKDSGNNKRNPTTTEALNVSPQEPKIAPNPKTKPIKTVKKDSGNNKRNPTTTEAPNVSPQEPKITLNPKTKPIKTVEKDSGNNKRNPTTTEAPNVSPQEPKITLNPKTKPIKTVEKGSGNNKRNPTTTEATNVSPTEPKITPSKNVKAKGKGKENANKNSNSKNNDVTTKPVKTKNSETTDKNLNSKKNNLTLASENIKTNEDAAPSVNSKRTDITSTKKLDKNTVLNNNNVTKRNKGEKIKVFNNNTLKVRPQAGQSKLEKPINETSGILDKSLRSRVIDLSTSLVSDKTGLSNKSVMKKRGRPSKNKNVSKISKEDNSRSDISFTLTEKSSPSRPNKRALIKNAKMKTRRSDVSFTLTSDTKSLNKTTRAKKNSIGHREVKALQLSTPFFLRSCNKSSSKWGKIQCC